jgi:23S rRNA C2498 (ribose-2'-O)-methylase RlmM
MKKLVCYCHECTEKEIADDFLKNSGHSSIMAQIIEQRQNNICRCDDKHPEQR